MAHKALIGGTAYEISGGKTLVGGTAYKIDKGKTLVGGTAYEIAFKPSVIMVNITGTGKASNVYLTINGQSYYSATTLEINAGTSITARVYSTKAGYGGITLNGTVVAEPAAYALAEYTFVPDCAEVNIALSYTSGFTQYGTITITTS